MSDSKNFPSFAKGETLLIATHNPGKTREIGALLAPFGITVTDAATMGLPEPVEDGDSYRANAEIKARASAEASGLPALADDSGLSVAALGGQPGIYSARWAGPDKDFSRAMEQVEEALAAHPGERRAAFICALSLFWPDGRYVTVEGRIDGTLVWPPRGTRGFGYDPMFVPDGYTETFGEMDPATKHAISHRADAFRQLTALCFPE